MPQLLFPGNSAAIAVETGLIIYFAQRYGFSGTVPNMMTIVGVSALIGIYNFLYYPSDLQNGATGYTNVIPPITASALPSPRTNLADVNTSRAFDLIGGRPVASNSMGGSNMPPTPTKIAWSGLGPSVGLITLETAAALAFSEYQGGAIAPIDIAGAAVLVFIYNTYIQQYVAPYLLEFHNDVSNIL